MFCYKCGTKALEGARFCVKCGTPLDAQEAQAQQVHAQAQEADTPPRRFPWRAVELALVGILFLLGPFIGVFYFTFRPTPYRILADAAQAYGKMTSLKTRSEISLTLNFGSIKWDVPTTQTAFYKRPNLLQVTQNTRQPFFPFFLGKSDQTSTIVCDGKNLYYEMPGFNQTVKQDAPATLREALDTVSQGTRWNLFASSSPARTWLSELTFFEGIDYNEQIKEAKLEGREVRGDRRLYVLDIILRDGTKQKMWFGVDDHLLWRSEINTSTKGAAGPFGTLSMFITEQFTEITPNPPLTPDRFTYTRKPGYQIVSQLNWGQWGGVRVWRSTRRLVGKRAPDFKLETTDGKKFSLKSFRGHVVVLVFFDTEDERSVETLTAIQNVWQDLNGKGFQPLAVSSHADAPTLQTFAHQHELTFPILIGNWQVSSQYQAYAMPHLFVIDRQGVVRQEVSAASVNEGWLHRELRKLGVR